ncbi:MAG: hypothetical protein WCP62_18575, partial [Planctomycetota bacterium]
MNTESIAENSANSAAYQSLSFSTSPWLVLVSVLACAACFALSWLAIRRSGYSRGVLGLELLRCGAVLLGAILLNQPEWIQDFRSTQKPTFAILVDRSPSMQTQDVLVDKKATSRQTAVEGISKQDAWSELSNIANVVISDFPPQGVVDGTD